jgi:hypothetical protein
MTIVDDPNADFTIDMDFEADEDGVVRKINAIHSISPKYASPMFHAIPAIHGEYRDHPRRFRFSNLQHC